MMIRPFNTKLIKPQSNIVRSNLDACGIEASINRGTNWSAGLPATWPCVHIMSHFINALSCLGVKVADNVLLIWIQKLDSYLSFASSSVLYTVHSIIHGTCFKISSKLGGAKR